MKLSIKVASTSQTVNVFIQDSSSTVGAGLTGLAFNSGSLVAYYALPRAAAVSITLATQTVTGAYSSGGFVEISSANMPGWYRLDIPDAALASGRFVSIHLKGATNMAPVPIEIELTGWDNQSATNGGMSLIVDNWNVALPGSYASGTSGYILGHLSAGADPWATALPGSYTSGQAGAILPAIKTKTDSLTFTAAGYVDANTLKLGGTTQTARDIGASVLLSSGTGTGQVSLSSGLVKVQISTKINTALNGFTFLMVDTAGIPRTGLTVTAQRSLDGSAFSSCANAVSEISNGFYKIDLATTDMNGVLVMLRFTATGAQDKPILIITTP